MSEMRPLSHWDLWTATGFSAFLSAITVVGMLLTYASLGGSNPSMIMVFLCNLPLAFMFAAFPVKRTNERIQALEIRLMELEAARAQK